MQLSSIDQPLKGYIFWHDPGRRYPYRWAVSQVPSGYTKRHGVHHGGAESPNGAQVAAERHAFNVGEGLTLHTP